MTTVIIDYGSGNLRSAHKAFERAARETGRPAAVAVSDRPEAVAAADRIVLPGVGAFADCYQGLAAIDGMVEALEEAVRSRGRPFLGICVGMQLMAERGLEHKVSRGLGWLAGDVVRLAPHAGGEVPPEGFKIPHMGWNTLLPARPHPLLEGIEPGRAGAHAYFVHSYALAPQDEAVVIARTDYGGPFPSVVGRDTMVGTQFHPEKSQAVGLKLIGNFLGWAP